MVSEVNMVGDNQKEWWYDTGATTHICADREMFSTYQKSKSTEQLFMGNSAFSKIIGRGKVVLKELTLQNVKHVPDMRKNLISGTLMSKAGFATNFESDKLMLKKFGVFIGRGYVKNELVKMCVTTVLRNSDVASTSNVAISNVVESDSMNEKNPVAYLLESFNIWHEQLGHVNKNR